MSEEPPAESDQLPEEGPPGQVVDDTGADRDSGSAGGAGGEGHGTGHPDHDPPGAADGEEGEG
ncbi:MAG TPA: hypothetical protein VNT32_14590 [Thermoleophilaceae bacterium]|nr:hypothetical protein [Thermoleophilaceae bacterium]